jgi:ferritin-like protein
MASNEIEVLDPAATVGKIKKLASGRALNRRHFMAAIGMTGAAAAVSGCSSNTSAALTGSSGPSQTDVLNFALNLEYLEATYYSWITQGGDIPANLRAGSGTLTGTPAKITFPNQQITDLVNEIYYDEVNHVSALLSLLGPAAVVRPAINLAGSALGTIATAASALSLARTFEDVGITAYAGAATFLSDSNLTFAAQILGAESFHSGALRLISIQNAIPYTQADSYDVPPRDEGSAALAAAGPTANGGFFTTAYATASSSGSTISGVPAGYAFTRSVAQVLTIVYGGGTTNGGFFPNGVSGLINSTTSPV